MLLLLKRKAASGGLQCFVSGWMKHRALISISDASFLPPGPIKSFMLGGGGRRIARCRATERGEGVLVSGTQIFFDCGECGCEYGDYPKPAFTFFGAPPRLRGAN